MIEKARDSKKRKREKKKIWKLQFVSVATRQLPYANTTQWLKSQKKEQYYFKILK